MSNSQEEWRSIPGWEGIYEVSSHGNVRSCDRVVHFTNGRSRHHPPAMLRPWLQVYPTVALQDKQSGRYLRTFVHRLVCMAFHGAAPSPEHEVAHNDGDPLNSHYSNLRWSTHVENEADKRRHGTAPIGERHGAAKLTAEDVKIIRESSAPLAQLAERFGVSTPHICIIRKGRSWKHELELT